MRIPWLVRQFAPPAAAFLAHQAISAQLETASKESLKAPQGVTTSTCRRYYDCETNRHRILEDKARTSLVGLTLSVSVLVAGSTLLRNVPVSAGHRLLLVALLVAGVVYLLAGVAAALMVLRVAQFYRPKLEEANLPDAVHQCTKLNQLIGLQKTNFTYDSYVGMRNGILCLALFGLLALLSPAPNNAEQGSRQTRLVEVRNYSVVDPGHPDVLGRSAVGNDLHRISVSTRLRVRRQPTLEGEVVGFLHNCELVQVLEESQEWALVEAVTGCSQGVRGWVAAEYFLPP